MRPPRRCAPLNAKPVGAVPAPATLSANTTLHCFERDITMTCVSNEVGGGYIGSATWLGVRLTDILDRAGVGFHQTQRKVQNA